MKKAIVLAIAALALAACDYGQTRNSFQHKVAGTVLVYEKKNLRQRVKKDPKSGRLEYWGIEFVPET
jgi:hypothetical protein